MFVGGFNSKLESFGCAKNKNTPKQLTLIYLNNDENTHMDRSSGSTDLYVLSEKIWFFGGLDAGIEGGIQSSDVKRLQETKLSPVVVFVYNSSVP